jgi:sigma-B regulation protein RsbU (phosphoserine phosphatase)
VQLQPGDVVVYYTDGYIEVANTRGERLETAGLMDAIQRAAQLLRVARGDPGKSLCADGCFEPPGSHFVVPEPAVELELLFREEISLRPMPVDDTTLVVLKVLPEPEAA